MKFMSTRGGVRGVSLEEAILSGYAPDGGLYVPENLPHFSPAQLQAWAPLSYPQLVEELLKQFTSPEELTHQEIHDIVNGCFSRFSDVNIVPIAKVGPIHVAELWHGPTGSFKDLPVSLIGRLANHLLKQRGKKATFLVGTAGNTGSATLHSVIDSRNISAIVLFPRGRISQIQELQMTTVCAPNVRVYSADGSPDDLDVPLKSIFADSEFSKKHTPTCLNSINLGRVLFHIAHFIFSYLQICPKADREVVFSVPSGGLGNVAGGYMAHLIGLPVKLLAAVNDNDVVHRMFSSGVFSPSGEVLHTYASAMDTDRPANAERLFYFMSGGNCDMVKGIMDDLEKKGSCNLPSELLERNRCVLTARVSMEETLSTMKYVWREFQYPLCPHSAVGVHAALNYLHPGGRKEGEREETVGAVRDELVVVLATATAAKFPEVLERAGVPVPSFPALAGLQDRPEAKLFLERGEDWVAVLKRDMEQLQQQN